VGSSKPRGRRNKEGLGRKLGSPGSYRSWRQGRGRTEMAGIGARTPAAGVGNGVRVDAWGLPGAILRAERF
jgi:hypothetical protein